MSKTFDNIIDQIKAREGEDKCRASMAGPSLLTYPEKVDSNRLLMFNSHMNQRVVLNETESPRVFGNYENIVGEYSSFNHKAKSEMELLNVIYKFPKMKDSLDFQKAYFFVYDKDKEMYDVIERKDVEDLTEKYGFQYDNSGINNYKVGDTIHKGDTLSKSTSYDEYGNYGFGKNVKAMYLVDLDTLEDAIVVSESLAKSMKSTEVEKVKVPINDNDFLLNLYGDNDNYKAFPDIGEFTNDKILCVKRRIINSQILFDLKSGNTKKQLGSDVAKYVSGQVVDIDIYCNKPLDEIPHTIFNAQLIDYIEMTNAFYTEIKEYTQQLIDTGVPCSQKIKYLQKRATGLTDPDYIIKDEGNNEFSNIIIYFTVKREVGLDKGQKLTGRIFISYARLL